MNNTTFKKAPFRVLATLIAVEALLIGQQLTKPAPAYAQEKKAEEKKAEDCKVIKNPIGERDCWVRKFQAGEKNLKGANLQGANLTKAKLRGAYLSGANLSGAKRDRAKRDGIKKDEYTKGL